MAVLNITYGHGLRLSARLQTRKLTGSSQSDIEIVSFTIRSENHFVDSDHRNLPIKDFYTMTSHPFELKVGSIILFPIICRL